MRRARGWLLLAGAYAAVAVAVASTAEPLVLRFHPEQGLTVTYEFTAEGELAVSMPGATPETHPIHASGEYTDKVVSVQGKLRKIDRRLKSMSVEFGGQKQDAPPEALAEAQTIVMDELGARVDDATAQKGKPASPSGADPVEILTAGLGFIPFPETAVGVGDAWDNSTAMTLLSKDLRVAATTTLESVYESSGMQVALTQTDFRCEGEMKSGPTGGAGPGPVMTVSLRGAILQSSRIEDGCLLGMKSTMSGSATMEMPGVGSIRMELKNVNTRLQVAG